MTFLQRHYIEEFQKHSSSPEFMRGWNDELNANGTFLKTAEDRFVSDLNSFLASEGFTEKVASVQEAQELTQKACDDLRADFRKAALADGKSEDYVQGIFNETEKLAIRQIKAAALVKEAAGLGDLARGLLSRARNLFRRGATPTTTGTALHPSAAGAANEAVTLPASFKTVSEAYSAPGYTSPGAFFQGTGAGSSSAAFTGSAKPAVVPAGHLNPNSTIGSGNNTFTPPSPVAVSQVPGRPAAQPGATAPASQPAGLAPAFNATPNVGPTGGQTIRPMTPTAPATPTPTSPAAPQSFGQRAANMAGRAWNNPIMNGSKNWGVNAGAASLGAIGGPIGALGMGALSRYGLKGVGKAGLGLGLGTYGAYKGVQGMLGTSDRMDATGMPEGRNDLTSAVSNKWMGGIGGAILAYLLAQQAGAGGALSLGAGMLGGLGGYKYFPELMNRMKDAPGTGANMADYQQFMMNRYDPSRNMGFMGGT